MSHDSRTALRICPLCEATCGLTLTIEGTTVTGARGDRDDIFSRGFICPKGASFGGLDGDPDRLRVPLVRGEDGELREATWAEAFDRIADRIPALTGAHGPQAVGVVLGNPNVHTMAGSLYPAPAARRPAHPQRVHGEHPGPDAQARLQRAALRRRARHPRTGSRPHRPPPADRRQPLESNGSLCTAPDFPGRLKALRRRGGTLTVIDPRRTRTARLADRHVAIRPGADALLLAAMAHVLLREKLADPGPLAEHLEGADELDAALADFTPDAVAAACDVDAATITALARELAAAPTAAVYARIGSCTVEHGTLASWLVDVLNILTGNLDRPGGALFPLSATARAPRAAAPGKGFALGRWASRVSGHPEAKGELPTAALAEEIETPGEGRIRALVVLAANPVLSAPDGDRLDAALAGRLDFMVSVDPYLNETSRHADVVLPPPPPSQSAHFDFAFNSFAVHNQVRYTPAPVPLEDGRMDESEIHARLILAVSGMHGAPPSAVDDLAITTAITRAGAPEELAGELTGESGPERRLDLMLRLGPYGLTLEELLAHPHGIDLGPLKPRVPEILRTRSGRIELLPAPIAADLPRLRRALGESPAPLVLVGRRHLRSNNSWMHNVGSLSGGSNVCTLQIHPDDAARLGLVGGATVRIESAGGGVEAPAEITDTVRSGVVSLPHGWGHSRPGTRMSVAAAHPGVNVNQLLDGTLLDPLSGTAVLNAIPVTVTVTPSP